MKNRAGKKRSTPPLFNSSGALHTAEWMRGPVGLADKGTAAVCTGKKPLLRRRAKRAAGSRLSERESPRESGASPFAGSRANDAPGLRAKSNPVRVEAHAGNRPFTASAGGVTCTACAPPAQTGYACFPHGLLRRTFRPVRRTGLPIWARALARHRKTTACAPVHTACAKMLAVPAAAGV